MVVTVNSCCCGCTLKTGSLIIGVLQIIGGILFMWQGFAGSAAIASVDKEGQLTGLKTLLIIIGITGLVQVIFSILLVVGANKEKASYLKPWVIYSIVMCVIILLLSLITIGLYFKAGNSQQGITHIISIIIELALYIYFIIVVNSYYLELSGQPK